MAPTKHKCFNCGEPTGTMVWSVAKRARKKWICDAAACWKKWWKLGEEEAAA